MRDFVCRTCGQQLSFENTLCLKCSSHLGFHLPTRTIYSFDASEEPDIEGTTLTRCANSTVASCNWMVEKGVGKEALCESCRLTVTRPSDSDTDALEKFAEAELAKRRVILELTELELPIVGRSEDGQNGLGFDLLSSENRKVITGHANGLITLDLAEGDDVHREQLRVSMDEPYLSLIHI